MKKISKKIQLLNDVVEAGGQLINFVGVKKMIETQSDNNALASKNFLKWWYSSDEQGRRKNQDILIQQTQAFNFDIQNSAKMITDNIKRTNEMQRHYQKKITNLNQQQEKYQQLIQERSSPNFLTDDQIKIIKEDCEKLRQILLSQSIKNDRSYNEVLDLIKKIHKEDIFNDQYFFQQQVGLKLKDVEDDDEETGKIKGRKGEIGLKNKQTIDYEAYEQGYNVSSNELINLISMTVLAADLTIRTFENERDYNQIKEIENQILAINDKKLRQEVREESRDQFNLAQKEDTREIIQLRYGQLDQQINPSLQMITQQKGEGERMDIEEEDDNIKNQQEQIRDLIDLYKENQDSEVFQYILMQGYNPQWEEDKVGGEKQNLMHSENKWDFKLDFKFINDKLQLIFSDIIVPVALSQFQKQLGTTFNINFDLVPKIISGIKYAYQGVNEVKNVYQDYSNFENELRNKKTPDHIKQDFEFLKSQRERFQIDQKKLNDYITSRNQMDDLMMNQKKIENKDLYHIWNTMKSMPDGYKELFIDRLNAEVGGANLGDKIQFDIILFDDKFKYHPSSDYVRGVGYVENIAYIEKYFKQVMAIKQYAYDNLNYVGGEEGKKREDYVKKVDSNFLGHAQAIASLSLLDIQQKFKEVEGKNLLDFQEPDKGFFDYFTFKGVYPEKFAEFNQQLVKYINPNNRVAYQEKYDDMKKRGEPGVEAVASNYPQVKQALNGDFSGIISSNGQRQPLKTIRELIDEQDTQKRREAFEQIDRYKKRQEYEKQRDEYYSRLETAQALKDLPNALEQEQHQLYQSQKIAAQEIKHLTDNLQLEEEVYIPPFPELPMGQPEQKDIQVVKEQKKTNVIITPVLQIKDLDQQDQFEQIQQIWKKDQIERIELEEGGGGVQKKEVAIIKMPDLKIFPQGTYQEIYDDQSRLKQSQIHDYELAIAQNKLDQIQEQISAIKDSSTNISLQPLSQQWEEQYKKSQMNISLQPLSQQWEERYKKSKMDWQDQYYMKKKQELGEYVPFAQQVFKDTINEWDEYVTGQTFPIAKSMLEFTQKQLKEMLVLPTAKVFYKETLPSIQKFMTKTMYESMQEYDGRPLVEYGKEKLKRAYHHLQEATQYDKDYKFLRQPVNYTNPIPGQIWEGMQSIGEGIQSVGEGVYKHFQERVLPTADKDYKFLRQPVNYTNPIPGQIKGILQSAQEQSRPLTEYGQEKLKKVKHHLQNVYQRSNFQKVQPEEMKVMFHPQQQQQQVQQQKQDIEKPVNKTAAEQIWGGIKSVGENIGHVGSAKFWLKEREMKGMPEEIKKVMQHHNKNKTTQQQRLAETKSWQLNKENQQYLDQKLFQPQQKQQQQYVLPEEIKNVMYHHNKNKIMQQQQQQQQQPHIDKPVNKTSTLIDMESYSQPYRLQKINHENVFQQISKMKNPSITQQQNIFKDMIQGRNQDKFKAHNLPFQQLTSNLQQEAGNIPFDQEDIKQILIDPNIGGVEEEEEQNIIPVEIDENKILPNDIENLLPKESKPQLQQHVQEVMEFKVPFANKQKETGVVLHYKENNNKGDVKNLNWHYEQERRNYDFLRSGDGEGKMPGGGDGGGGNLVGGGGGGGGGGKPSAPISDHFINPLILAKGEEDKKKKKEKETRIMKYNWGWQGVSSLGEYMTGFSQKNKIRFKYPFEEEERVEKSTSLVERPLGGNKITTYHGIGIGGRGQPFLPHTPASGGEVNAGKTHVNYFGPPPVVGGVGDSLKDIDTQRQRQFDKDNSKKDGHKYQLQLVAQAEARHGNDDPPPPDDPPPKSYYLGFKQSDPWRKKEKDDGKTHKFIPNIDLRKEDEDDEGDPNARVDYNPIEEFIENDQRQSGIQRYFNDKIIIYKRTAEVKAELEKKIKKKGKKNKKVKKDGQDVVVSSIQKGVQDGKGKKEPLQKEKKKKEDKFKIKKSAIKEDYAMIINLGGRMKVVALIHDMIKLDESQQQLLNFNMNIKNVGTIHMILVMYDLKNIIQFKSQWRQVNKSNKDMNIPQQKFMMVMEQMRQKLTSTTFKTTLQLTIMLDIIKLL